MNQVKIIDPATGDLKWERKAVLGHLEILDGAVAVHLTDEGHWDILDVATGKCRRSLPHSLGPGSKRCLIHHPEDGQAFCGIGRRDGSSFLDPWPKWLTPWAPTSAGAVQVIDVWSGRVTLDLRSKHELGAALSQDGETLVCYDWIEKSMVGPNGYSFRFYDIPNRRAWLWAIGVPGGLAALAWAWRRWRRWGQPVTTK